MIILGYFAVYWILGMAAVDILPPPNYPRYGNTASWCRPHPYEKLQWKPWPFGTRYSNKANEGDTDICTGEVYHDGAWRHEVKP